ncbi:hypothetical protein AHiyo4_10700 [Arthrobacter sp. Hiyo4]|nr:hypothetical protein AHiyo4_10700 [Arthrobacter sp. Hiyo4]
MSGLPASPKLRVSLPSQNLVDALEPSAGVELFLWDLTGPAPAEQFDIVVPPYMGGVGALAALDSVDVGLVQSQLIGYDGVEAVLPAGCLFANAAGVHETSTAELALGMIIASQRGSRTLCGMRPREPGTTASAPAWPTGACSWWATGEWGRRLRPGCCRSRPR